MASISFSEREPDIWILSGWSFRMLFERVLEHIDETDTDFDEIQPSYYMQAIAFDLLDVEEARQVAAKFADIEARMLAFAASADDSP